jgi:hypothetical protein
VAGNKHDVEKAKAVIDAITSVYHHEITHPGVVRRPFDAQRSAAYNRAACNARRTHSRNHEAVANRRSTSSRTPNGIVRNSKPSAVLICCVALLPREASVCGRRGYDALVGSARWELAE